MNLAALEAAPWRPGVHVVAFLQTSTECADAHQA